MAYRNDVTGFACQIAEAAAISAAAGLAIAATAAPLRHVIGAQADVAVAIVAVLAVSALVGASVAVIAGACPAAPSKGD